MNDFPEWLVPLIIAGIYFLNMFLSKGKAEPDQTEAPARRFSEEDPDAEERQRRVQEEIRRKIMERRAGSGQATPPSLARETRGERPEAEASQGQRRPQREQVKGAPQPGSPVLAPTAEVAASEINDRFSWDTSDNVYEKQMEARLQQIEATKRQASQLRKQADSASRSFPKARQARKAGPAVFRAGSVRGTLRDPAAARTAFVYGEVMSPPIALRKGEGSAPGAGS